MRDPSSSSSSSHKTLGGYRFDNNVAGCVQRRSRAVICIGIISHLHSEKVVLVLVVDPSTSLSLLAGNSKAVCGLSLTASPKEFEHGASLSRQLDHKVSVMRRRFSLTMSTGLFVSCHSGFATVGPGRDGHWITTRLHGVKIWTNKSDDFWTGWHDLCSKIYSFKCVDFTSQDTGPVLPNLPCE